MSILMFLKYNLVVSHSSFTGPKVKLTTQWHKPRTQQCLLGMTPSIIHRPRQNMPWCKYLSMHCKYSNKVFLPFWEFEVGYFDMCFPTLWGLSVLSRKHINDFSHSWCCCVIVFCFLAVFTRGWKAYWMRNTLNISWPLIRSLGLRCATCTN